MKLSTPALKALAAKLVSGHAQSAEIAEVVHDKEIAARLATCMRRSDWLPKLFKVKGEPFDLTDYPQFRALYDAPYTSELIYMCGRQLGKSINLSRSETLDCSQIPHFQVLYVAPLQSQTNRYSSMYLREAVRSCEVATYLQQHSKAAGPAAQAVGHQSFNNGAGIQLTYAKTSPDRARGIFCDRLDCDELQDHVVDNLAVVMQSLTQSKWNLRRYTGTAKTVDNTIEYYWQKSSRGEWVTRCGCGHWNIPNIDGNVLEMIHPEGPCCVRCGNLLRVREGQWVHARPDLVDEFPGYHVPQIVVPAVVYDQRKWSALYTKVARAPTALVYQEILGISSSIGARLITQDDITKQSVLPSVSKLHELRNRYSVVVGGIDWGIAEQQSFTVYTVIGCLPDGRMHVLWAKRYVGFDTDNMLKDIARTHKYYRCDLLCADFGMGFTQNTMLATRFGLPVVQIQYSSQNQFLSYRPLLGYPRWVVDKVTALQVMFFSIRYGRIQFPPVEEFKRYTDDLLSPFQAIRLDRGTERVLFTRNPNMPDDFANALCFGMLGTLKLIGSDLLDAVPSGAMGTDTNISGVPELDCVDPSEILRPA